MSDRAKVCIVQYNASTFLARVDRSARTLAEMGFEVVLIALQMDDEPAFEQREGYVVKRVPMKWRKKTRRLRAFRWIEAVSRTYAAASREQADIYNARDIYPLMVCWLAAKRRRARFVYDSDELNLYRNWPWTSKRWWQVLGGAYEGFFIRRADLNITTDTGRADILEKRYGIERPTIVMNVPDLVDPIRPDEAFRARALGGQQHLLLYTGTLIPNRGLLECVDALAELPGCALAYVGFGHLAEKIKDRIAEKGLEERAQVFGAVPYETLIGYTAAADIGLVPIVGSCLSYVYAAPNKLFEYMMAGLPVAASDLPDMAAIVEEDRVGKLIDDPTDPVDIAAAVRELLDGEEPLEAYGTRGQRAVRERFNWGLEKRRLVEAYEKLGV
jgi:glycosyltransferase involved in cell wall biosynthesis